MKTFSAWTNAPLTWMGLLSSLTLSCTKEEASSLKDKVQVEAMELQPNLGNGYDSLNQKLRNTVHCVTGTETQTETGFANTSLSQSSTMDSDWNEWTGEVKGTPRTIFDKSTWSLGLYRSNRREKSAFEVMYQSRIIQNTKRLTQVQLSSQAEGYTPFETFQKCGDDYVAQIHYGGVLAISIKLVYGNEENRSKWQSLFEGPLPYVQFLKDLKQKTESGLLKGTLVINVHQVGGNPAQSLSAAQSCTLKKSDDIEVCLKKMEDLLAYSGSSFPTQIQSHPAPIAYMTLPLTDLGKSGLPSLPEGILEIRKDLADRLNELENLKNTIWVEKDGAAGHTEKMTLNEVNEYQQAIKKVANLCYSPSVVGEQLDYTSCQKQYAALKKEDTRPSSRGVDTFLIVDAKDPKGTLYTNQTSRSMSIEYEWDPSSRWSIGGLTQVTSLGSGQGRCSKGCLDPSSPKGSVLLQSPRGITQVQEKGLIALLPGESFLFTVNDDIRSFQDNRGAVKFNLKFEPKKKDLTLKTLLLDPSNRRGTSYTHLGERASMRVQYLGYWSLSSATGPLSPFTSSQSCGSSCLLPSAPKNAVLVKRSSGRLEALQAPDENLTMGVPGARPLGSSTLNVNKNETLWFLVNDSVSSHSDNAGFLHVTLQINDNGRDVNSFPLSNPEED